MSKLPSLQKHRNDLKSSKSGLRSLASLVAGVAASFALGSAVAAHPARAAAQPTVSAERKDQANAPKLVLKSAQPNLLLAQDHSSHESHASHESHSSHYSSYAYPVVSAHHHM
jgi:hypothetical protein